MTQKLRVRRRKGANEKTACYRYTWEGIEFSTADIEECESIHLIFSDNMDREDKVNVLEKWGHKIIIGAGE